MKSRHLLNYVKVYDKVLSPRHCELLTLVFDMSDKTEEVKTNVIDFTQLNLNKHHSTLVADLLQPVRTCLSKYKREVETYFPTNSLALEEFRIKRYNGGTGQQFRDHVDVGDLNSSRRYLAFLFYLNDDFTKGETRFFENHYIDPKCGSVLIFPPTWQYPHAGMPVKAGKKYILSTYLHYT